MSSTALQELAQRWANVEAAERANFQSYFKELCEALNVEPPRPAGTGYQFEYPIKVVARDGTESTNFIDCFKADHFAIEAKDEEPSRSTDLLLRKAFGQVRTYVGYVPGERPPYLMVLDVAKSLLVWDRWNGDYGGFSAGRRIDLARLADRPDDCALLRDIFEDPAARDPRARAAAVTKEVAAHLANLAAALEAEGHDQEDVARFIMRCIFTMFAEDVGLLRNEPFRQVLALAAQDPGTFAKNAEALWTAMDAGEDFLLRKLLRFNGHFFKDHKAMSLGRDALLILQMAADADWQHVEPSIFGTLLVRAIDPQERHRLGAQFTPREFVERVVRPAVEEPLREQWTAVQAEVLQLREARKGKQAKKRLRDFHNSLKQLRFLDPACGSGNFLYVTMHLVKRIELEVIRALEDVTGQHETRLEEVGPWQFYGIEVKAWAREITELVLWIGFHQFWKAHHDVQPPEPILEDTGTLECRDAVLVWDKVREDPTRARPDPTPRIRHPVSGRLIPDPSVRLTYDEYVNPRQASWPEADFIIGNPPYLGKQQKRKQLGDGYVDALQQAYPELPPAADYVMCWWHRAVELVAQGKVIRAGLITTNSIRQKQNRGVIEDAADLGAHVVWAVADHPWVDEAGSAAVRVSMTVTASACDEVVLAHVNAGGRLIERRGTRMNSDLTLGVDVARAGGEPLLANEGLATVGFKLYGDGFILEEEEAERLLSMEARHRLILRPFFNGQDLAGRPRGVFLIDFGTRTEREAEQYPVLFDLVRVRVKPDRDANPNSDIRERWWQLGHNRLMLRKAVQGLRRFIVTPETTKHRFFQFLPVEAAPEGSLFCIASESAEVLGVLSSSIHTAWALRAAGAMGKGNDPRYNKAGFDAYPFPEFRGDVGKRIAAVTETLDAHRKNALARSENITTTGMYNVVAKLRRAEPLSDKEWEIHSVAACGVLKDLHDELDQLVAEAYGWDWSLEPEVILERLVALHNQRLKEEEVGNVRWLRPEYQVEGLGRAAEPAAPVLELPDTKAAARIAPKPAWPGTAIEQIAAIKKLLAVAPLTPKELASTFAGANVDMIRRHLDTLDVMGEVQRQPDGRYRTAIVSSTA